MSTRLNLLRYDGKSRYDRIELGPSPCLYASQASSDPGMGSKLQMTLALIKPTVCSYQPDVSSILRIIKNTPGIIAVRQKRLFWKQSEAEEFYKEHEGRFYYDRLISGMTSGPSIALALAGPDAIKQWREMLGPTKAYRAKWESPGGLRARFGLGDTRNGFHGSDSPESAKRELSNVFEGFEVEAWLEYEQDRRLKMGA
ncbi:hypothetical protein CBS101457_003269 [Exobasidium rhododendri]|nr:hypothetical protein CBS101457_003269 [Exobasidium rhododendri]